MTSTPTDDAKHGTLLRIRHFLGSTILGNIIAATGIVIPIIFVIIGLNQEEPDDEPTITIDLSDQESIPRCVTVTGSAPILENKELWFANIANENDMYIEKIKHRTNGDWEITTKIGAIGGTGEEFDIFVFYLDEEMSKFLEGIVGLTDNEEGYWHANELPPGAYETESVTVIRNADVDDSDCF